MEIDKAIGLIEAHGVFHGDHYSFNSGEFVQWCQEDTHQTLSLEQANHDPLAKLKGECTKPGGQSWRSTKPSD